MNIKENNKRILDDMSHYLNLHAQCITKNEMESLMKSCNLNETKAYTFLLASYCGLDLENSGEDKEYFHRYYEKMIIKEEKKTYQDNAYYRDIVFPNVDKNGWTLKMDAYEPYEAFVENDMFLLPDGRVIPQIGYFNEKFMFPSIYQNNRQWMSITPNEINTMTPSLQTIHGKVVTFGLGFGYYAFMASMKEDVSEVTIIEKDKRVIEIFNEFILPQFKYKSKIHILCIDAFYYLAHQMRKGEFDYAFVDLWHDVSDGLPMYQKIKKLEKMYSGTTFHYWIEPTMKCYLK